MQIRSKALELYETVQYAGNVVPRLYLLITVGKAYVENNPSCAKDVLQDLVSMARGVQHPIRGLFLRAYLTQASRAMLPSNSDVSVASVHNSVEFILENFEEMNKLWCRMQHSIDREKKERDRQELRDLIGKNLLVLSQLDGVDIALYREKVLPKILEQVVNCEDSLAQPYLMDAIVQAFADEYHLATLDKLLESSRNLNALVSVGDVLAGLMSRLGSYASESEEGKQQVDGARTFERFLAVLSNLHVDYPEMEPHEVARAHAALLNFTLEAHEERLEQVDEVLSSCSRLLQASKRVEDASDELNGMLNTILHQYEILEVLGLDCFPDIMELLPQDEYKEMAKQVVEIMLDRGAVIDSAQDVKLMMRLISPLLDWPASTDDADEFESEQNMVAKLLHQLQSDDVDEQKIIIDLLTDRVLSVGGLRRLRCILPALLFRRLCLVRQLDSGLPERQLEELQNAYRLAQRFSELPQQGERALRLFLNLLLVANFAEVEDVAYCALEEVSKLFEISLGTWQQRHSALCLIISTLQRVSVFSPENWNAASGTVEGYCATILRKADQSRALAQCAHLHQRRISSSRCRYDTPHAVGLEGASEQQPDAMEDGWSAHNQKDVSVSIAADKHEQLHVNVEGYHSTEVETLPSTTNNSTKRAYSVQGEGQHAVSNNAGIGRCLRRAVECADSDSRQKHAALGRELPNLVLYADLMSKHVYFLCANEGGVTVNEMKALWHRVNTMIDAHPKDDNEARAEARRRLHSLVRYVRRKQAEAGQHNELPELSSFVPNEYISN